MLLADFGRGQANETVISFGRETKAKAKGIPKPRPKTFLCSFLLG
jgi:hypothetical protein